MKKFSLILALALSAGCASQPVSMVTQSIKAAPVGFGTLADANDPIEMAAAPVVNRLALHVYGIASALKNHKITREQERSFRSEAENLAAYLRQSVARRDMAMIKSASLTLDGYVKNLENMQ